jgi:hypothetical protein
MNHKRLFAFPVVVFAVLVLALFAAARAEEDHDKLGPYKLITTITPAGFGLGFDISWVDSEAGRYYLADRGSNAGVTPKVPAHIDVIDTRHLKLLAPLPVNFAGNGVTVIRKSNDDDEGEGEEGEGAKELWVGDANSFVEVIDLKSGSIVDNILTGGLGRADELAYDPLDHILLVANDRDNPPFVTFISTRLNAKKKHDVLGTLSYPQAVFGPPGKPSNHGLEQPVWNPKTRRFYLAVPGTSTNPGGEVDEINPRTRKVTEVFPTNCNAGAAPAGLVLVPHQRLVVSCGDIISLGSEHGLKTPIAGLGGDEIWFNPGDERVYFGGGLSFLNSSVPVLDIETNNVVDVLPIKDPKLTVLQFTHSVAADSETNRIFVPVSNVGIQVWARGDDDEGHHHDE